MNCNSADAVTRRLALSGPEFYGMVVRPMADIEFDGAASPLRLRSSRRFLAMRCFCVWRGGVVGVPDTRLSSASTRAGKKSRVVG